MLIPLATEFSYRTGTPRQSCTNYYAEATPQGPRPYSLRPRAGLVSRYQVGLGPVWLVITAGSHTYTLSGNEVYYDQTLVGTVAVGNTKQADLSDEQLVIVSGGSAYLIEYTTAPTTMTQVNDPDLPLVSGVVFASGRFIYPELDSGTYYYSEINDAGNIDGLGFANAEANPDPIVRAAILGDQVVFFGTNSIEFHSPTNDPAAPFQRAPGQTQDKGCIAPYSVVKADNSLFWIGQDEGSGRLVFRTSGGVPQIVSTPAISAALQQATATDIVESGAFLHVGDGHAFYVGNIVGVGSYGYDISTGKWATWASYGLTTFRVLSGSGPLYGDHEGNIYSFDADTPTDGDDAISRVTSCFIPIESRGKCSLLVLEMATGLSPLLGPEALVEMRFSDGLTGDFSQWEPASLGEHGDRGIRALWVQLGQMTSPGRLFEFRITSPALTVPFDVMMNVRP